MIPRKIRKIAKKIRKKVPKPLFLPKLINYEPDNAVLRWDDHCPLGLLPGSLSKAPGCKAQLPDYRFSFKKIRKFTVWWDSQADPYNAVEDLWTRSMK